ncbi:MAG: disulfide bond formation protein B [Acetobacteraceae bacterium]|nr:disulfide bond formation protein B [Acetobacteraceae bacterium]
MSRANLLALLIPAALLAGAWGFQLIGGLTPCEMCHWQRWPHYAALAVAALAFAARGNARVALVALAAVLIAASGVIGVLHAGVEYHWWNGFTACTAPTSISGATAAERLDSLLRQPVVRCDTPQWTLGGVSMAGFNALFSLGGALVIMGLLLRKAR